MANCPHVYRTFFGKATPKNRKEKKDSAAVSGAEINCIDKATYEQLTGVVMILSLNMEMVSHSNHRVPFMGVYKNVRLAVRLIKYEVCLFIIDVKTSHSLMLGVPFIF
jgi:hypothetical protein